MALETLLHLPLTTTENLTQAVPLYAEHLEQLAPAGDEGIELLRVGIWQRPDRWSHTLREQRENIRINASERSSCQALWMRFAAMVVVCLELGKDSGCAGKATAIDLPEMVSDLVSSGKGAKHLPDADAIVFTSCPARGHQGRRLPAWDETGVPSRTRKSCCPS